MNATENMFDETNIDDLMTAVERGSLPARCQAWAQVLNAKKTLKAIGRCMTGDEYAKCYVKISNTIARLREIDRIRGTVTAY